MKTYKVIAVMPDGLTEEFPGLTLAEASKLMDMLMTDSESIQMVAERV